MMADAEGLGRALPVGDAIPYEWTPPFSPKQMEFYHSIARWCLAYGERYSGKTFVGAHKLVRHCWNHWNALSIVVVSVRRQATSGGIWHKIVTEVLPEWQKHQPGFESSEPKMDTATKDLFIWVRNKWGGKSMVQLVSIPHGGNLSDRVRGIEASMIYVDELTTVDGPDFFDALIQQLGRRPHIPREAQQYVATTNPDGPSHWAYDRFFRIPQQADGSWDERYAKFHIPISDNPDPTAQTYYQNVLEGTRNDPIEYARLIKGEWVDRPSGEAIFGRSFVPEIHIRGNLHENLILQPKPGLPITLGYDLGDANHSIIFTQDRLTADKTVTVVFDEIVYTDDAVSFEKLVPEIMERMNYWCDVSNYAYTFGHISDKSAFDRFRAQTGSYDHRQVELIAKEELEKRKSRYAWLSRPIRLEECPKPPGSVAARIKVLTHKLQSEEIYFSALCENMIDAMKFLESEKGEAFKPKRSKHLHPYDALTYILYHQALGGAVVPTPLNKATPQLFQMKS